jgi:hypothetical protein
MAAPAPADRSVRGIRPPDPLILTEGKVAENWRIFRQRWENYCIIETTLADRPREYKVALLLNYLGDDALKKYNGFHFATPAADRTVEEIIQKFEEYAIGQVNVTYERYKFNSRKQEPTETFEEYLATLRYLLNSCAYCDQCRDGLVRDRIVLGIRNGDSRKLLLQERNLTLERAIDICRSCERAEQQGKEMQPKPETDTTVDLVRKKGPQQKFKPKPEFAATRGSTDRSYITCKYCGKRHPANRDSCPARTARCHQCSKIGHFSSVCLSSRKQQNDEVNENCPSEDEAFDFQLDIIHTDSGAQPWTVKLRMASQSISFKIDSGADVSIITWDTYLQLRRPTLTSSQVKLRGAGGQLLDCLGKIQMAVRRKGKSYTLQFYVVKGAKNNLLSREASAAMDLIHLSLQETTVYGDIGRMNVQPVQIKLVSDATPYCTMTPRRVPLPLIARVRNELARMEQAGVIRKITEPTEWCAPIVPVVKPNNSVRICVDLKRLNKSVLRERYILPTIEDILPDLKDAKVFSTLDASSGFWAIPLEEEIQKLTTFITPYGRYCFRRLPFGISSAPEIFMRIMHELLQDIPGTATYMDDILVYGRTMQEHDERLKKVLATIQKSGLRLNKDKCILRKEEIDFLGHHLTPAGVQPSPAKKMAITKLSPPKNITELRSFIGMTN